MVKTTEEHIQIGRDLLAIALGAADDWRAKGNPGEELFSLYGAVQEYLSIAVLKYDSADEGIRFLNAELRPTFDRAFQLIRQLHVEKLGSLEESPPPGLHNLILCVHAAWLMDLCGEARELAAVCSDDDCLRHFQYDAFWREYAQGLAAVASRTPFTPRPLRKAKGYERHWTTYLRLMADLSSGNDATESCAAIDESFAQRNRDKRLIGDCLDGDGEAPVKWDFRKHSLLKAREM